MRNLFILRGSPASGKSTWVKENNLEPYTLSADSIRLMYQTPITTISGERVISQCNDKEVWDLLMRLLEVKMSKGEFIIIDATYYKASLINKYKDLVHKYRYRVNVVDFSQVPEEECLKRNAERDSYKKVPEETIRKMYACLHDDSEVKKAYKLISPEEAARIIKEPLEPVKVDDKYKHVVIFGDIHGCLEPLNDYFKKSPFNEETCYIFCGDYIDRGVQNKEVLEFLLEIYDKPNVFLIEGNHERWLRAYSSKDYIDPEEKKEPEYNDYCISKVIDQLKYKQAVLEKSIKKNNQVINELMKLSQETGENEVFFEFEKVNVRERTKELDLANKESIKLNEEVKHYIYVLSHEEDNSGNVVSLCENWYLNRFNEPLSLNIKNLVSKKLNLSENKVENPIKSLEFLRKTVPQIKEIDKSKLRRLCEKFIQMSYFTFADKTYLVTHAGLSCLPDIKTPTEEMIKGIGKYEEVKEIEEAFKNNVANVIQVHGHRNIMKEKAVDESWRNVNLEGNVEYGGHLRVLIIEKHEDGSSSAWIDEIKNNTYISEQTEEKVEESDLDVLKNMLHSKLIQVKELKDNIISLNFTRDAFYDRKWNELTCHARGLFVNKSNGDVVARSFVKFHNFKEVPETETAGLKENFVFPVVGYKKENGFLGIVSKYKDKVRFFTKSSDQGDYVNWFIGALCENYGITALIPKGLLIDGRQYSSLKYSSVYNCLVKAREELSSYKNNRKYEQPNDLDWEYIKDIEGAITTYEVICNGLKEKLADRLNDSIIEGYSYVFECVDPDNDPHIIKYEKPIVFLLEVFKNQLKEEHCDWEDLIGISNILHVPLKQRELEFKTWEQFESWKDKFTKDITQWDCKHEGYVLEDDNGFRVKFKSSFYKFWKQMRAIKDGIAGGRGNKKIYKTKEEIQVVKLLESIPREDLKSMSIIDVEDKFYETYEG